MKNVFVLYLQYWHYINVILFPSVWYILMNYLHVKGIGINSLIDTLEDKSIFEINKNHFILKKFRNKTILDTLEYFHSIHNMAGWFIFALLLSGLLYYQNNKYIIILDIIFVMFVIAATIFRKIHSIFFYDKNYLFFGAYFILLMVGKAIAAESIYFFLQEDIIKLLKEMKLYSAEYCFSIEHILSIQIILFLTGLAYLIKTLLLKRFLSKIAKKNVYLFIFKEKVG